MSQITNLTVKNFGPVKDARFTFGALNVFIGPQGAGKSLVFQLIKLLSDTGAVQETLKRYGVVWRDAKEFIERMFGEGTRTIVSDETKVIVDGKSIAFETLARKENRSTVENVFYIPAQRVLAIDPHSGWVRGFFDYRVHDPLVLRDFSEKLRVLIDQEAGTTIGKNDVKITELFPNKKYLSKEVQESLTRSIFDDARLAIEVSGGQRRLVLRRQQGISIPFTAWSAGQREFAPLLLGTYYLQPNEKAKQKGGYRSVIIEEIEMGLHPRGISSAVLLLLDLMQRGYRVFLSTHSARVIDYIWAITKFRELGAGAEYVLKLFDLPKRQSTQLLAESALDRSKHIRAYYFDQASGRVLDISTLDTGSEEKIVAEWGELVGIAGKASELVAEVVANQNQKQKADARVNVRTAELPQMDFDEHSAHLYFSRF